MGGALASASWHIPRQWAWGTASPTCHAMLVPCGALVPRALQMRAASARRRCVVRRWALMSWRRNRDAFSIKMPGEHRYPYLPGAHPARHRPAVEKEWESRCSPSQFMTASTSVLLCMLVGGSDLGQVSTSTGNFLSVLTDGVRPPPRELHPSSGDAGPISDKLQAASSDCSAAAVPTALPTSRPYQGILRALGATGAEGKVVLSSQRRTALAVRGCRGPHRQVPEYRRRKSKGLWTVSATHRLLRVPGCPS